MRKLLLSVVTAAERTRLWLLHQRWFTSVLLPAMPRQLRWGLRKVYLAPIDLADRALKRRNPDVPAKAATFTGAVADFAESGQALVDALADVAAMTPSSAVLDIGCGIGRLARAMTTYLAADGRYEGIDIVPEGIEWCRAHISSANGNVNFTLADIHNKEYNPKGRTSAAQYTFPYDDDTFDVTVLISVFTHMLTDEVDHYISEIGRMLKPGGRCYASMFLINPRSRQQIDAGKTSMRFHPFEGPCWTISNRVPELGVAFDEEHVLGMYAKHGFAIEQPIYRGMWSGERSRWPEGSGLGDQDTVVATKL